MPLTAKLSENFYLRFGHEATDELVEWLNSTSMDIFAYLERLNRANVEQFRLEIQSRFEVQDARIEAGFAAQDARIEAGFAAQDAKIDKRFAEFETKFEKRFSEQDTKIDRRFNEFESKLNRHLFAGVCAIVVPLVTLVWQSFRH